MASSELARPEVPNFVDLLRSFPGQARLALGTRGVLWASFAGIVGVVCCVVAFAAIGLSLHRSDVDPERLKAREVLALDNASHLLMRSILASSSTGQATAATPIADAPWRHFTESLATLCRDFEVAPQTTLGATCAAQPAFVERVGREIRALNAGRRPIDAAALRELLRLRDEITELSLSTTTAADELIGHLIDDYTVALLVLTLSTTGFVCAGLVLILLVGRTSMDYHAQWRLAAQAARQAGASRDMLSEVVEALPAGVVVYDSTEHLIMCNSVARTLTPALRQPNAIGRTYSELAHDSARGLEAAGMGPQPVQEWIERLRTKTTERTRQADDGRWFDWSEKGTPGGLTVGLRVDVTDIKQHQFALEKARAEQANARARYQSLVDSMVDVAYTLDVETGQFTFASAAVADLFGIAPEKFVGTHFLAHIAPESIDRVRSQTTREYEPNDPGTFARFSMITAGGAVRHVEVRAKRWRDEQGRVVSTGVIRDVEERVQLEQRLDSEMTRLRSIVESGGALIVLVDRALNVAMVNSGFTALTGITAADAVGRPLQEILPCPLNPERTKRSRFAVRRRDPTGRERLIAITATPATDADGAVSNIMLLGVDDTERREAEQALYNAERFATVGEMAGTMAHEISQPLQVINIACASALDEFALALERGGQPDSVFVQGKLDRIARQVEQASRIIGDLRAFVRGTSSDTPEPFDPNEAVRRAIDLTGHGVREAGMTLQEGLDPQLPPVLGDAGHLAQVLVNLINNARDAGGAAISIATGTVRENGRTFVRIAVEDSGHGIPSEILPKLFTSFVTTKPSGKGTGLGLRICRRILEEMGGRISAANRAEGGARFEIILPS
ncbi:MAG: PAS domain S-box protein [Rhodospirillaceae bacterium]|nr:PAS domain S-box protein [Rhodospirillaceae bacterium]